MGEILEPVFTGGKLLFHLRKWANAKILPVPHFFLYGSVSIRESSIFLPAVYGKEIM